MTTIKHLYLISGIYDLSQLRYTSVNELNKLGLFESNIRKVSPMHFDFVPWQQFPLDIHIFAAQNDSTTFRVQSECFGKRLKHEFGLNTNCRLIDNCDHFDVVENLAQSSYEITKEIIRNLDV